MRKGARGGADKKKKSSPGHFACDHVECVDVRVVQVHTFLAHCELEPVHCIVEFEAASQVMDNLSSIIHSCNLRHSKSISLP